MSRITEAAKNLPSDPDYSLLSFAEKVIQQSQIGNVAEDDAIFAVRFIRSFSEKFGTNISIRYPEGGSISAQAINVANQIVKSRPELLAKKVDVEIADLLSDYANAQDNSFGLAHLNEEEKKKVLQGLERIRVIIGTSELSDRKKNALYDRLSDLIREVNSHGTKTDRFFAFAGDVGFVLGDFATKAKPFLVEVKEVLRIVTRSRARQEGVSLPPGDEVLQLPSPDGSTFEGEKI